MDDTLKRAILSPDEIKRYKRHLLVKEIGGQGQQRLKAARVLIVGAGGLGSPLVMYLAAAGVGKIGVIDDDRVSIDNLQRQIAFKTADVGALKAERAAALCQSLNPHVSVEAMPFRLTAENALSIIANLRHCGRRFGQFQHALSRERRLLFRSKAARVRGAWTTRRLSFHLSRL